MKLKDILARELKVWPEGAFSITQDYDLDVNQVMQDCTPLISDSNRVWRANPGMLEISVFETKELAGDYATAIVTRAEWQAAVDALNAPKVVEWDGAGLPPVGVECEVHNCQHEYTKQFNGKNVRVVAHHVNRGGTRVAVFESIDSVYHGLVSEKFRPIPTAEQVVAEDHSRTPEWSEDGLPNVGTKCVIYKGSYDLHADADKFIGPVVTVAARFKSACGIEMACVDSGGDLGCHVFRADMCFHLPTAEEVAAGEREKAVAAMLELDPYLPNTTMGMMSRADFCRKLYDENYRKQVAK